jgi:hypothetical protein
MGTIINFPESRRSIRDDGAIPVDAERGNVIILPVIRIERLTREPTDDVPAGTGDTPGRRRRRRNARP